VRPDGVTRFSALVELRGHQRLDHQHLREAALGAADVAPRRVRQDGGDMDVGRIPARLEDQPHHGLRRPPARPLLRGNQHPVQRHHRDGILRPQERLDPGPVRDAKGLCGMRGHRHQAVLAALLRGGGRDGREHRGGDGERNQAHGSM
jgi:hypothetical protein